MTTRTGSCERCHKAPVRWWAYTPVGNLLVCGRCLPATITRLAYKVSDPAAWSAAYPDDGDGTDAPAQRARWQWGHDKAPASVRISPAPAYHAAMQKVTR